MMTEHLLSYISVVFQDVYLFHDTVYNNIKIGNNDASRDQVIAAAKSAQCHEFIKKLGNGYDTMVGEGGSTLSGGEKQRISIARAILKDAPIVLLDEATASLDPENELLIQNAISELVKSKTLIVIAHRLSTIAHADKILVIDNGRIIERGKHAELIKKGGLYSRMWDKQQQARGWKLGAHQRSSRKIKEVMSKFS
jgi:ATP-binding cassette subfamily B protein IrtB